MRPQFSIFSSEDDAQLSRFGEFEAIDFTQAKSFGENSPFAEGETESTISNITTLPLSDGFTINDRGGTSFGVRLNSAGDFNGDGIDDMIIGAEAWSPGAGAAQSGAAYIVFGTDGNRTANLSVDGAPTADFIRLTGINSGDGFGVGVTSIGDINGDGFDDVVIGSRGEDSNGSSTGAAYVIYGDANPTSFNMANINGTNGFRIEGASGSDFTGFAVTDLGDVNGDGIDDFAVGANGGDATINGQVATNTGEVYVIYGGQDHSGGLLTLANLDPLEGFVINGASAFFLAGTDIGGAGDFNGDGINDILVGQDGGGGGNGRLSIVYGEAGSSRSSVDLVDLEAGNSTEGFTFTGQNNGALGRKVDFIGDYNGDGYDDFVVSEPLRSQRTTGAQEGRSYVVFGRDGLSQAMPEDIGAYITAASNRGFILNTNESPDNALDRLGIDVASAGDFNGDGFDDLIVSRDGDGESWLIYGAQQGPATNFLTVDNITPAQGFRIDNLNGSSRFAENVASAGDINNDGFDDLMIGDLISAEAIIVYGEAPNTAVSRTGSAAGQTILGSDVNDVINGEGGDDILKGRGGDDSLNGGDGNDTIFGGGGSNAIDGGRGFDTVSYATEAGAGSPQGVTINLDSTTRAGVASNTVSHSNGEIDTLRFIEFATGSDGADMIFGSSRRNTLIGEDGDDTINGRGGNDLLEGGAGDDIIDGSAGFDRAAYSNASSGVDVRLELGRTINDGQGGRDTLTSIEEVQGSDFVDLIIGDTVNNRLFGGDGDDRLFGRDGNDIIFGENGDDDLRGENGSDRLYGEDGDDLMLGGAGVDIMDGGAGNDDMRGGADGDRMFGREGNDTMRGDDGIDILNGQEGDDILFGGADRDFLRGQEGDDTIYGGTGDDRMDGGVGDFDVAVYSGNIADYDIVIRSNGVISVEDLRTGSVNEGRDVLTNFEELQFTDGTVFVGVI